MINLNKFYLFYGKSININKLSFTFIIYLRPKRVNIRLWNDKSSWSWVNLIMED